MDTWRKATAVKSPSTLVNTAFSSPVPASLKHSLASRLCKAVQSFELPAEIKGQLNSKDKEVEGKDLGAIGYLEFLEAARRNTRRNSTGEVALAGLASRLFDSGALQSYISSAIGGTLSVKPKRLGGDFTTGRGDWKQVTAGSGSSKVHKHYARTTTVGPHTRITDEVTGSPVSIDLVQIRASHDINPGATHGDSQGGPLTVSCMVTSDLRRHHKVAVEGGAWMANGSHAGALVTSDWAPRVGFGPPTVGLIWSQRLHDQLMVVSRYITNKSLRQVVLQPVLKINQQHEVSTIWQRTLGSHSEVGVQYRCIMQEGPKKEAEKAITISSLWRRTNNGAQVAYSFRIQGKVGEVD